ncbi:hypothetical protein AVEN_143819-1 [Araneus ventricosus]|uniref:Uncharacterized protein n=1 Tax=Araneus ventricosus TaxID=182803 RepID=A0A4Y2TKL2_ARAVE|nr:hypothetical protein AVEN_143819-1 [Araneus ventricosus]
MTSRARAYKRRQPKGRGLWSFVCSASWKAGELGAIESAPTVIISDLLTVCVAKSQRVVVVITSELLLLLLVSCCLFALLICTRAIVPVTCAWCSPEYL